MMESQQRRVQAGLRPTLRCMVQHTLKTTATDQDHSHSSLSRSLLPPLSLACAPALP